jgi:Transport protein Avl9
MGTQLSGYAHTNTLSYPFSLVRHPLCYCIAHPHADERETGLLQTLDDCGSPPLASRAPTLSRPTSLRTSDHKSMMAYLGLPLDIFGKVCVCVSKMSFRDIYWLLGRLLPALPTAATDGHAEGDQQLALWEHEFNRDATEGD